MQRAFLISKILSDRCSNAEQYYDIFQELKKDDKAG